MSPAVTRPSAAAIFRFLAFAAASMLCLASCASTGNTARSLAEVTPRPPVPASLIDTSVPVYTTATGIEYVRTPDERFAHLKDFPYQAHYLEVDGLRLAYEDEGPREAPVVLMLHGQPDWSYLYRKMIPPITAAGYRCIALDLMGFGRSDKPIDGAIHTCERHVAWVKAFIHGLGLKDITLFCQDWGGLIGLRIVGDEPELFARVVAANTTLPVMAEGAKGQPHQRFDAGHFIQDDLGPQMAAIVVKFIEDNPLPAGGT